jgi:hypothetical protein
MACHCANCAELEQQNAALRKLPLRVHKSRAIGVAIDRAVTGTHVDRLEQLDEDVAAEAR